MKGKELSENEISRAVIGAAVEVHRHLGPGLLESAYQKCLAYELASKGLHVEQERVLPVSYKGVVIDCGYRIDLLIEGKVVIEVKCVEEILPIHRAQLLTYLRLLPARLGLLINFKVPVLRAGIQRMVNGLE